MSQEAAVVHWEIVIQRQKFDCCNQRQKARAGHIFQYEKLVLVMAAADHNSLVSSISVYSLTRIKYRWFGANYRVIEIWEQEGNETKMKKSRWQLSTGVKRDIIKRSLQYVWEDRWERTRGGIKWSRSLWTSRLCQKMLIYIWCLKRTVSPPATQSHFN